MARNKIDIIFDILKGKDQLSPGLKKSKKEASSLKKTIASIGIAAAGIGAAFAAVSFGKKITEAASKIQTLETSFTTLTGSVSEAKKIMEELSDFSARTPFQLTGIAEAAKQLLAFGFEQDQIIDKLQKIGDVAAGSGADLKEVALIYGQVAAASKLSGERLLQFQERAIPIGPAIAKTMGIAENAVKDAVSKGKVSLAIFEKAFASLSEEGGMFSGGIERQSKTWSGAISTLKDNLFLLNSEMGEIIITSPQVIGVINGLTDGLVKLKKVVKDNKEVFESLVSATIKAFAGAIGVAAKATLRFSKNITHLGAALKIAKDFFFTDSLEDYAEKEAELLRQQHENIISTEEFTEKMGALIAKRKEAITEGDESIKSYGEEVKAIEDLESAIDSIITGLDKKGKAKVEVDVAGKKGDDEEDGVEEEKAKDEVKKKGEKRLFAGLEGAIASSFTKGAAGAEQLFETVASGIGGAIAGPAGAAVGGVLADFALQSKEQITKSIDQFFDAIPGLIDRLIENIPVIVERLAVKLGEKAPEIAGKLAASMPLVANSLAAQAPTIAIEFINALVDNAPKFIEELISSFQEQFDLFKDDGPLGFVGDFGSSIGDAFGGIGDALGFAKGGEIPAGFNKDNFLMRASSGENVVDRSTNEKLNQFLDQQSGPMQVQVTAGDVNKDLLQDILITFNKTNLRLT